MFEERCGEDSRCKASHALFSVRSDILDPAAVTAGLGIGPSRAWAKGEEYQSARGRHRRPWGMWHLSTEGRVASRSPEQQALYLLGLLEPRAGFVRLLLEDPAYLVLVKFWWESRDNIGGFELSSNTARRLAAVTNNIGFTVIGTCEDEEADEPANPPGQGVAAGGNSEEEGAEAREN
jgi:hypothetical protein